jgi:transcriptional regulator with XRE-family HTH domain
MTKATSTALAAWLKAKRISQVEFARRVGVDPNTVYRWVKGDRRPYWKTMEKIAAETGGEVTADSFLSCSAA